jgi:carboxymethylenebutenolidase
MENYYVVEPQTGTGQGVLVLHAWWGLNTFFKKLCGRVAKEGFVVLAPDLYDGETASTIEEAEELSSKLKSETVSQTITQAAQRLLALSGPGKRSLGVIGFSLGGSWALWLTEQKSSPVAATVVFYATRPGNYRDSPSALQFHLAETDVYEPASEVKRLQESLAAAGKAATLYTYPGTTHWFFEQDREDAYVATAAELAWNRTIVFLRDHLAT